MRTIFEIPHSAFKITVFTWNEKYLVELEAGPLKQVFKIPVDKISDIEQLKLLVDDVFIEECAKNFDAMFHNFKGTIDRNLD